MEKTRPEYGWDAAERGKGSNTAITTQLISTGVTERISVTPSMFAQPGGGEGGGGVRRERRKSDFLFQSVHSFLFLQAFVPF